MIFAKLAALVFSVLLHAANPISYEYSGQTDKSGGAYILVTANQDLDGVEVSIQGDGQSIVKKIGDVAAGQRFDVSWKQSSGRARYEVDIRSSSVEASFVFEVVRAVSEGALGKLGTLKVRSTRDDIVQRGQATFETQFPLKSYEYKVYDAEGDVVAADEVIGDIAAGERFTLEWTRGVDVFMIFVRGEDEFGRFVEQKLVPWAVEIPHTEINFDSGKWDIKNQESPKLDEAVAVAFHELVAVEKVNAIVSANVKPRLYIVGFTDTVGSAGSNQRLSQSRAKAIAEYFRDKGFWAAIYFAGMGERGLRVETGDNVDEVRNRRALYLMYDQHPPGGGQIPPPSRWSQLVGPRPRPEGFELPPLPERWANYRDSKQVAALGGETNLEDELPQREEPAPAPRAATPEDLDMDYGDGTQPGSEGPPPVEGEPGASSKGCSIGAAGSSQVSGWWLGLAGAGVGFRRRRRNDPGAKPGRRRDGAGRGA